MTEINTQLEIDTKKVHVNADGVTVIPEGVKITGFSVKKPNEQETQTEKLNNKEQKVEHNRRATDKLERVSEETNRPFKLKGHTYKIKPPHEKNSLYLTVNDILMNEGTDHEQEYPYEIFLNSKDMESYQWITTVTRTVSAIFRKGGNITFIVEELELITQPDGGYWSKDHFIGKGKFFGSVVAEIGHILRHHMEELGLMEPKFKPINQKTNKPPVKQALQKNETITNTQTQEIKSENKESESQESNDSISDDDIVDIPDNVYNRDIKCKECGDDLWTLMDGCWTCYTCGDSKCG